ncbi:NAD(P)H-dependent oxidoreductase [Allomuricauda sp. d1]|uniref:NAD(P)H-dependent oxidoreductase n=1 Tax=Allomuricauda sp. d1 TaxID=3136725 RepID=UPI0031DDAECA
MNNVLETRNWRYATKKFDPNKIVSQGDLDTLLEATRLSASSYGLQPYKIFVVSDLELKKKLRPVSWNQSQVEDASHLIIFVNERNFGEELIDEYIEKVEEIRGVPEAQLKTYSDFMKSKLMDLPQHSKNNWTARQVCIALGNLMQAAAELKIDTCPMEGFEVEKYNQILGLNDNLSVSVVLPIGYRSQEDETQHYPKVRKTKEELFTYI